ncbi:MAG: recombinase family protein [Phycisphaerales bacterium]
MSRSPATKPETIRCAIYTRKSSDEGLDQEFNSLDAQRESAEAFIASQKAQGWKCRPDRYDDGGFSGGSMERPSLDRLIKDIEDGKIDCVVVYKVDRLSRSLMDFSRIMETFDAHGVSFVSVTQQFNTTSSMGRLTLNILLSFAQFEREIIGERIRDKIAAQKRKGKWAGGVPILGYDVDRSGGSPKLVVNAKEAARVRQFFALYLEKQSLQPVVRELDRKGWRNKKRITKKGRVIGDKAFDKATLYAHLKNPLYKGMISHKGELYAGEHEAIIDEEQFDRVQKILSYNGRTGGKEVRNKYGAILRGLLRCKACDHAMTHVFTTSRGKSRKQYRYYRCVGSIKKGACTCPSGSLPAQAIEQLVVDEARAAMTDRALIKQILGDSNEVLVQELKDRERDLHDIQKELKRLDRELRRAVGEPGDRTARVAELNEAIMADQKREKMLREELDRLRSQRIDPPQAERRLKNFDEVWSNLIPREQARLLKLLIERVEYDSESQSVSVTFRPSGIKSLAKEAA